MSPPFQTATPLQWRISAGFRPKSNRYIGPRVADRKCQKLAVFRQCSGVAVSNPPLRRKGGVWEAVAVPPCRPRRLHWRGDLRAVPMVTMVPDAMVAP